jgi:hypothetical protein
MDRKAHDSVLFCPSMRGGADGGRLTGLIGPAGHMRRQIGRPDLEFQPAPPGRGFPPGIACLSPLGQGARAC